MSHPNFAKILFLLFLSAFLIFSASKKFDFVSLSFLVFWGFNAKVNLRICYSFFSWFACSISHVHATWAAVTHHIDSMRHITLWFVRVLWFSINTTVRALLPIVLHTLHVCKCFERSRVGLKGFGSFDQQQFQRGWAWIWTARWRVAHWRWWNSRWGSQRRRWRTDLGAHALEEPAIKVKSSVST